MKTNHQLQKLWKRGCDFLGSEKAILGGAMTWVSNYKLVSAISNAGGFGVLASGSMEPKMLDDEIKKVLGQTTKPFGVNIITMHPQINNLIDVCLKNNVSHVVFAGGLPTTESFSLLKKENCKIISFAPSLVIAKKLIRMGSDALIIEGNEAGGHIGPVSTSVLAQEIIPHIKEVPVFVAGGIGRGEMIVNYLKLGAAGCQLGTRFVCATESPAHENFKNAFIRANSRDAVASTQLDPRFPVIPVRAITNQATTKFQETQRQLISEYEKGNVSLKEAQLKIEHFWAGSLKKAVIDGDIENGSIMAGQIVGMVSKIQTTQEIIDELTEQAENFANQINEYKQAI